MKLAKTSGALSLLALAALGSQFAVADDAAWYGGANIGRSSATIDDGRIRSGLAAGGFASSTISDENRATGYKIFGGRQFNRNFAIEGGYFNLGEFGYTATTVPAGTLRGTMKVQGLNLDLVGILPVTDRFSLFGRAGLIYADTQDNFSSTGAIRVTNPNPGRRGANYKLGVGMQYAFTENLSVRGEMERYRINDAIGNRGDIDLISVGLVYRFGANPSTRAATPEYVAPAPALAMATPAPAPDPTPPAPPVPRRRSFSADSLFDFDQSAVKPAGSQALDKFAAELRGSSYDTVHVTGHTDRIGTPAYNQKLSLRRAEAVKGYLVQAAGIPANKISAKGAGESEPVTKPGDCKGSKANKQLIACLQPDRRVDVDVSGTK